MNADKTISVDINGLTFEFDSAALRLKSMRQAGDAWLLPGENGRPFWELLAVDESGRRAFLNGDRAGAVSASGHDGGLTLRWEAVSDPGRGAGPFDVTVHIRPHAGAPCASAWRIEVVNHSEVWTLWHVIFPDFDGLAPSPDPEQDRLILPDGWGMQHVGWSNMPDVRRMYPMGWNFAMQFLAYTRGPKTLYLATHDPRLTTKLFRFSRCQGQAPPRANLGIVNSPENMSVAGNGFVQDYETVVAVLDGDWYDAARFYGNWARRQPWAARAKPARRQVHAWHKISLPDKPVRELADSLRPLADRIGAPMGIHFYCWHEIPFDTSYPDYFPARPEFRDLVAQSKQAGFVAMPYINARLWDVNAPSWPRSEAVRHAAKQSAERARPLTLSPYLEEYGNGQKLAAMCPATPFWQDTVAEICRRIVKELGCDGVYLDQVGAACAQRCFDPAHGHPLGGGGHWFEGCRQMMRRARQAVGPEALLTTECNWEGCNADFDGLLMWHSYGGGLIPLFPAVYAGMAETFGCNFNRCDIEEHGGVVFADRMAMLFAWGAQLGWGDLTPLLEERNRELCDYFASLCRLRAERAGLFIDGRMLRPPAVESDQPAVSIEERETSGRSITVEHAPVRAALWQTADCRECALFLVNVTRVAVSTEVLLTAEECSRAEFAPLPDGVGTLPPQAGRPRLRAVLPPLSARVVRMTATHARPCD